MSFIYMFPPNKRCPQQSQKRCNSSTSVCTSSMKVPSCENRSDIVPNPLGFRGGFGMLGVLGVLGVFRLLDPPTRGTY